VISFPYVNHESKIAVKEMCVLKFQFWVTTAPRNSTQPSFPDVRPCPPSPWSDREKKRRKSSRKRSRKRSPNVTWKNRLRRIYNSTGWAWEGITKRRSRNSACSIAGVRNCLTIWWKRSTRMISYQCLAWSTNTLAQNGCIRTRCQSWRMISECFNSLDSKTCGGNPRRLHRHL